MIKNRMTLEKHLIFVMMFGSEMFSGCMCIYNQDYITVTHTHTNTNKLINHENYQFGIIRFSLS